MPGANSYAAGREPNGRTVMQQDVIDLREFYARPLGGVVRHLITYRMRSLWRNVTGLSVFGLGYATPYLTVFRGEAARVGALMPAAQGVIAWPEGAPRLTALVDGDDLPLPDASVDRLFAVHSIEHAGSVRDVLREAWRVLSPEGRLLLVVPNRTGVWSQLDTTPFGHGQPYSRGQLTRLLREALLSPTEWYHTLYMPPFSWQILLRSAIAWERVGTVLWPVFSGVIVVEATKQIYAATGDASAKRVPGRMRTAPVRSVSPREGQ